MPVKTSKKKLHTAYDQKHELFKKYTKEIQEEQMSPFSLSTKETFDVCEKYISGEHSKWRNIFSENGDMCGFLIIGTEKENKENYSVLEAFVDKKHRGNGLLAKTLQEFAETHPGSYRVKPLTKWQVPYWEKLFKKLFSGTKNDENGLLVAKTKKKDAD